MMMGALGPLMTRTAGEVSDGLLVMPFNTLRHIEERTLPALQEGMERGGRTEGEVALLPEVITAVATTAEEYDAAVHAARRLVAFYASTPAYTPVLEVEGIADLQPHLQAMLRDGRAEQMAGEIGDDLLDAVAVRGTPAECAAKIADRFGRLAERVCVYFPGSAPSDAVVAELAEAVHRA